MKKAFFVSLLFALLLVVSGCGNPTGSNNTTVPPTHTATATVEQSAFTSFSNSSGIVDYGTTYGTGTLEYLWYSYAGGGTSLKEEVYIQFYMPQIPSGVSIESASLNIYITTFDASCTTTITQVTGAWQKAAISATNEPSISSVNASYINSTAVGWNYFDVTSLVRDWFDGAAANNGVKVFPYGTSGPSTINRTNLWDYSNAQYYPRISILYK